MEARDTFSLLFFLRKSKTNKKGLAPVYLRITTNGQRSELALKRWIEPSRWNSSKGCASGSGMDCKALNEFIDIVRSRMYAIHRDLIEREKPATAEAMKAVFQGKGQSSKNLLEVFAAHAEKLHALIETGEYAKGTVKVYNTSLRHLTDFVKDTYGVSDIRLRQLKYSFITDYDFYLRTKKKLSNDTALKHITRLKVIISVALKNEWIDRDPFAAYQKKYENHQRVHLTIYELARIEEKEFSIPRLAEIRDVFLFGCYTGYPYAELHKLTWDDVSRGIDSKLWVFTSRTKTKNASNVPLLPKPLEIIERYREHPLCQETGKLLPVKSNQKMNAYLKEVADLCGVTKTLTTHVARHTFATWALTQGVDIASVSKMLGHKNLATTQIYAKILDQKVSEDMGKLEQRLASQQSVAS